MKRFARFGLGLKALLLSLSLLACHSTSTPGAQETDEDLTLFRGANNNSYYALYFRAPLVPGAERVAMETFEVDLRPERDVTVHVEVFNPDGMIPLLITPGGMGDCDGFRGFARNVAVAAPDLKVILWDRRNVGRSEVAFGTEPWSIEEGEDLHVLIERLGVAPAALYGMSSGGRPSMIVADRYPDDVAALVIAPLTGGPVAAARLSEEYYLKYLSDVQLTTMSPVDGLPLESMEALAETPLWSAYLERNSKNNRARFFAQDIDAFLAAMRRSGEFLRGYRHRVALGMTNEELAGLSVPATLLLHHGNETDDVHPKTISLAASALIPNSKLAFPPHRPEVLEVLLPFIREHTPARR